MTHYISTVAMIKEGKPTFESISELDGKIIAWSDKVFAPLLMVGQQGRAVFVADNPDDVIDISEQLEEVGPSICLMEKRFFESTFNQETVMK